MRPLNGVIYEDKNYFNDHSHYVVSLISNEMLENQYVLKLNINQKIDAFFVLNHGNFRYHP